MTDTIEIIPSPRPEHEDWDAGVAAGLGDHCDRYLRGEYVECDACRAKPGMPMLCYGCLANRTTVGRLQREVRDLREALAEALEEWEGLWTSDNNDAPPARIAELRAKHLGK